MDVILKILRIIVIVAGAFFGITFIVYFFNLDMKLTSALYPIIDKNYDKVKRDKHL
jgi:predicted transcriptional regulator